MYNESDEMIVQKFVENPYYQYFCGNEYFEHSLPIDLSSMTRFRKRMGIETIEELFKETVTSAERSNQLKEKDFEQLNVDTTVQQKAISFPTDSKLYYKMLEELVDQTQKRGIVLRQSYKFVSESINQTSRIFTCKADQSGKKNDLELGTMLRKCFAKEAKDIFGSSLSGANKKVRIK